MVAQGNVRRRSRSKGPAKQAKGGKSASATASDDANKPVGAMPPPPFTIKDIRSAVPKHCFERSVLRSFSYVIFDLILVSSLAYAASYIPSVQPGWTQYLLWPLYHFICGVPATGLWVLAHECGHQAFSDYRWLNNAVGWVLHSALLVPYHSWRITHGNHHKNTNHHERDQVFVPSTKSQLGEAWREALSESPIVSLFYMTVMFTLGWPAYLIGNVASQTYDRRANHFEPSSPLFEPKNRADIIWSNVGIALALCSLFAWANAYSWKTVWLYYGGVYMWVNFWLILITFLQHTDRRLPHYRGKEWTFVRGALSTIDRDMGFLLNTLQHHIQDTHVAHHLFSTMPHYHAQEATEAIKPVLGEYYKSDSTHWAKAVWRSYRDCRFLEEHGDSGDLLCWQKPLIGDKFDDEGNVVARANEAPRARSNSASRKKRT